MIYLFIILTHSGMSYLKILPDKFSDFFPNSTGIHINLRHWEGDLSFC